MRAPEPNEEQRAVAKSFCEDHSKCGNGYLVDDFTVAELIAEREHALREQVATLTAHAAALEMNETYWIGEVDHLRATIAALTEWKTKRLHDEAKSQEMIERLTKEAKESDDTVTRLSDLLDVRDATIRGLTKERDENKAWAEQSDREADALASKCNGLEDDVERLTKERDQLAIDLDLAVVLVANAREQARADLAAIETLTSERNSIAGAAYVLVEELRNRHHGRMPETVLAAFDGVRGALGQLSADVIPSILAATADYAKKADEVEPNRIQELSDLIAKAGMVAFIDKRYFDDAGVQLAEPRTDIDRNGNPMADDVKGGG